MPIESDQPLVMPSTTDSDILRDLVIKGDMQGLIDKSITLAQRDASLKPFATKLQALAQEFELLKIRQFIDGSSSEGIPNELTKSGR